MNDLRSHRLVRILKAAVVLAALYTLGVLVLLALVGVLRSRALVLEGLSEIVVPFSIFFGFAFVVFAVARRIGFVLLWLVLVSFWLGMLFAGGISDLLYRGIAYPSGFLLWSALAFPLFAIGSMAPGRGSFLKIGPWSASASVTIGILWVLLFVGSVILELYAHPQSLFWTSTSSAITLAALGWILWAPMPLAIAAVSVRRFWVGSRPQSLSDAAA